MQMRRYRSMLHRQYGLDYTCNAGSGFKMADVGLDRADPQRSIRRSLSKYLAEGLDLYWIAQRRARTVRFNVIDVVCRQSRIRKGRAYQSFLRKAIWRGKTAAATVVVHRRAANDGQHGVTIALRIRQALECKLPQPSPRT